MLARFNLMLIFLLTACSLALVASQHRARKLFVDLERIQAHAVAHEIRWNQLQVEQTELVKASRIDERARRELGMQAVASDHTLHLSVDPVTRAVSLSQPWIERSDPSRPGGVRAAAAAAGARPAAKGGNGQSATTGGGRQ